jgi:hypothetical protein
MGELPVAPRPPVPVDPSQELQGSQVMAWKEVETPKNDCALMGNSVAGNRGKMFRMTQEPKAIDKRFNAQPDGVQPPGRQEADNRSNKSSL